MRKRGGRLNFDLFVTHPNTRPNPNHQPNPVVLNASATTERQTPDTHDRPDARDRAHEALRQAHTKRPLSETET